MSDSEIVRKHLRTRLGWNGRHDEAAEQVMQELGLKLPRDRELVRQLAFTRVALGKLEI
jgi:hypothetical protein